MGLAEDFLREGAGGDRGGNDPFKNWDLLVDARRSQAALGFLPTADEGRRVLALAVEDAQSEALAWKLWERREREEEGRQKAEEPGAEG